MKHQGKKWLFHSHGMMIHDDPSTNVHTQQKRQPAEIYPEEPYPKCFSFFPSESWGGPLWKGILGMDPFSLDGSSNEAHIEPQESGVEDDHDDQTN